MTTQPTQTEKFPAEKVFYFKLKNGEEIISIEEDVGKYLVSLMEQIDKSDDLPDIEKKKLKNDLRKEKKEENKKFGSSNNKFLELHYPMRVLTLPASTGQGALHLSFWVSPSIFPTQVMHLDEKEILIKTPVDTEVKNYYFLTVRKFIFLYAKKLQSAGHQFSNKGKSLIADLEEQMISEIEDNSIEVSSKEYEENNPVTNLVLNGTKRTVH